jgi:hypothetical protein
MLCKWVGFFEKRYKNWSKRYSRVLSFCDKMIPREKGEDLTRIIAAQIFFSLSKLTGLNSDVIQIFFFFKKSTAINSTGRNTV